MITSLWIRPFFYSGGKETCINSQVNDLAGQMIVTHRLTWDSLDFALEWGDKNL